MEKQKVCHGVHVICDGSPSRIRSVRRISLGMTILPRSSACVKQNPKIFKSPYISRASGLSTKLTLVIIQKQHKSQQKAGFYMVMEGFLLRPKRSKFIRPLFIYCPAIFFADDLQLPFVCGEDNILYICPTPMNACARSIS